MRTPSRQAVAPKPVRSTAVGSTRAKPRRCVVCGAVLRDGHPLGELVCSCHPRDGCNPRHDPHLGEHVLLLLLRAGGEPVNLYRALGCDVTDTNRTAIHEAVRRLNASGFVRIRGHKRVGYELTRLQRAREGG